MWTIQTPSATSASISTVTYIGPANLHAQKQQTDGELWPLAKALAGHQRIGTFPQDTDLQKDLACFFQFHGLTFLFDNICEMFNIN